ncbi:MAG: GLPGLI family protein [Dysgonamonadaceae bacterium]|jgi:GLPGLI family protein|nr:GLPGLI family protein [Dysgonamonadaceae bacterium]
MKKITLILSLLLVSLMCHTQIKVDLRGIELPRDVDLLDTLDYTILRCEYTQWIVQDTLRPTRGLKDRMLLQIGNKVSKFFNYSQFINDSIVRGQIMDGLSLQEILNLATGRKIGKITYEFFRGYPEKKSTYIGDITIDYFSYEEEVDVPEWKLLPDTMTVLGYLCKKATCTFHCRDYIAWYTPEVAVSEGPWKLTGLPGLVLKSYDEKRQILFNAVAIEKVEWKDPITYTLRRRLQQTTKSKFQRIYTDYMKNPGVIDQQYVTSDTPVRSKSKPYNPIELCE